MSNEFVASLKDRKVMHASTLAAFINKTPMVFRKYWKEYTTNPNFSPIFGGRTKAIYFCHGNLFEDKALDYLFDNFDLDSALLTEQAQEASSLNIYEKEYVKINDLDIKSYEARDGVKSKLYMDDKGIVLKQLTTERTGVTKYKIQWSIVDKKTWKTKKMGYVSRDLTFRGLKREYRLGERIYFKYSKIVKNKPESFHVIDIPALFPYIISSRPDGYYGDEHIIEIKCPWGNLYKAKNSPVGNGDGEEIFTIPTHYRLQMFLEMLVHGRRKGLFFQYYNPSGWQNFVRHLCNQVNNITELDKDDRVYKPWVDVDTNMTTVMNRVVNKLKLLNPANEDKWWRYCKIVGSLPRPVSNRTDDKLLYDERYVKRAYYVMQVTTREKLDDWFNEVEIKTIMQTLTFGSSFKVGSIVEHDEDNERIHIVWDVVRDNNLNVYVDGFYEWMDYDQFRVGYLHILRSLTTSIRRKNPEDWRAWEFDLKDGAISPEPPTPFSYPEAVLMELDLSDDDIWKGIIFALRNFLLDLKYKDDFRERNYYKELITVLENLPVKFIAKHSGMNQSTQLTQTLEAWKNLKI